MKRNKIYGLIVLLFAASVGLTSCLNDTNIEDQKYGLINLNAKKIVELPADASHTINLSVLDEGIKEFTYEVRLAAENPAEEDVVVNLEIVSDRANVLKAVRTYLSDSYPATGEDSIPDEDILSYPVAGITLPASVTIPKGQRSVALKVKIDTHQFTTDTQFALIQIKSVTNSGYIVSGNFNQLLFSCKVRHPYAGRYVCTGTYDDVTNAAFQHASIGLGDEEYLIDLETVDGSTLIIGASPTFGGSNRYLFFTGTGFSYFGSFCPQFTFDAAGNVIAVTNAYGQPAANTRSAQLDPSGINKYDPATKTIKVSYWMNQPLSVPTPPYHRGHMVETYTFKEDL
ncbi:MAG TPA: hypothetical protein PLH52_07185 [Paludibacteraceae bacterium]|nr:hypothetical protein [Paludibacteraceae bacterium]